jgi:hypothetical protein
MSSVLHPVNTQLALLPVIGFIVNPHAHFSLVMGHWPLRPGPVGPELHVG